MRMAAEERLAASAAGHSAGDTMREERGAYVGHGDNCGKEAMRAGVGSEGEP